MKQDEDMNSDIDDVDFANFKGMYYNDKTEKYTDPQTGCHFKYDDLCRRMEALKLKRKVLDKRLGIKTTSQVGSETEDAPCDSTTDNTRKYGSDLKSHKPKTLVSDAEMQKIKDLKTTSDDKAGHSERKHG